MQIFQTQTQAAGCNAKTDLLNSIVFLPSRDNVLTAMKSPQSAANSHRDRAATRMR